MFFHLLPLSIFSDFFDWISSFFSGFITWVYDFFSSLVEVVQSAVMIIKNMFTGLIDFIKCLPAVITLLNSGVENLPSVVLPFATMSIVVAVVLLVLGRSNNS